MTDQNTNPDDVEPAGGVALGAWLQDRQARNQAAVNERHVRQRAEARVLNPTKVADAGEHLRGQVTQADLDAVHGHRASRTELLELRGRMAVAHAIGAAPGLAAEMQKLDNRNRG